MEINNPNNQSYWFVVREDQSNVIFSSNNFTIQNPHSQETRYIVDTGERQFIQINNDTPIVEQETLPETFDKDAKAKDEDGFWDRSKIRLLLSLCLDSRYRHAGREKPLWGEIAAHLHTSADECNNKYRNLRRTYIRLLKKKRSGKEVKWIHYNTCEEVFKECKSLPNSVLEPWEEHKVRRLLTLYIENLDRFRSSTCLQKDIWRDIATQLGTTEYSCYHKFKNLKRAYFTWKERSNQTGKPIKWQYHNYFERIFHNYSPTAGPWDRAKTKLLIDSYLQIADKFKNPRFQKKELWKDIAAKVGEDPTTCDKKFRNMKQTYIRLKTRADSGRCITKWRFYKDFEAIYSTPGHHTRSNEAAKICRSQEDNYVKQLLTFYIENKEKFRNPLKKKKSVWRQFAPKVGLSSEECDRKFRNLKQTYVRLLEKRKETGKINNWPYFTYFEQIFDESANTRGSSSVNVDDVTLAEVKQVMLEMQNKRDNDRFDKLVHAIEESNKIQRERNRILQALLNRK